MARLIFFLVVVTAVVAYEELELRKNAKPNYDLDNLLFGEQFVQSNVGINPHIVGGDESVPNSRPYQAGLFISIDGANTFCGGSLINRQTILTAAHCVDGTTSFVAVVLGAHYVLQTEPTQQMILSSNIILHPEWSRPTLAHDIAIIHLRQPAIINEYVNTILLPRSANERYTGNHSLVSGWGRPSDSTGAISTVLREVSSPIMSNIPCRLAYFGLVTDDHICISGGYGKGTCNGDSGSPLTLNGVQIGVVSFGTNIGCEVGWPSVFARVTSYLDWIADNSANITDITTESGDLNKKQPSEHIEGNLLLPVDPEFSVKSDGTLT